MANEVFANGRELSCKAGSGKSICAFPDVCFTPPECPATPPGVPIPYPNTGMTSDTTSGSKTVKISGKEVMLKNQSYFKKSSGDEAGCAAKKGVLTSVNRGKVYFTSWSMDVKIEGKNAVRHLDLTTHNHMSMPGNTPTWPFIDTMSPTPPEKKEECPPHEFECEPVPRKPGQKDKTKDERRQELSLGKKEGDEFERRCSIHNDSEIQSGDDMGLSYRCKKCGMTKEVDHVTRDHPGGPVKKIVQCKSDQSKTDPTKKGVKIKPKQVSADRDLRDSLNKCQKDSGVEVTIQYKLEEGDAAEKAKEFLREDITATSVK